MPWDNRHTSRRKAELPRNWKQIWQCVLPWRRHLRQYQRHSSVRVQHRLAARSREIDGDWNAEPQPKPVIWATSVKGHPSFYRVA